MTTRSENFLNLNSSKKKFAATRKCRVYNLTFFLMLQPYSRYRYNYIPLSRTTNVSLKKRSHVARVRA